MFIDRRMDKEDVGKKYIYIYNGILLIHKKEWNNAILQDGPRDYHISEVSRTEKDKYHMISMICGIQKKNDANEFIYKIEIYSHFDNKLMVTKGERGGRGIN